jgi:hypothetical protein
MPSKRELIDNPPRNNGLSWSKIQWGRISAFLLGISSPFLVFSLLNSQWVPSWMIAVTLTIPMILLYYGFTQISWREALKAGMGMIVASLVEIHMLS